MKKFIFYDPVSRPLRGADSVNTLLVVVFFYSRYNVPLVAQRNVSIVAHTRHLSPFLKLCSLHR